MAKVAKRGRPKLNIKKLQDERNEYYERWQLNLGMLIKAKKDLDALIKETEQRNDHIQDLNDMVGELRERNTDLLAEIRMYEQETATLKQIIIDALRQKD